MKAASSVSGPPAVEQALLDQAIGWMVRLGSAQADPVTRSAWAAWRGAHPSHEQAWQQVQAVEDAFLGLPSMGGSEGALAHEALQAAARLRSRSRRRGLGLLGVAAVGAVLGTLLWRERPWLQRSDYASGLGQRRRELLADGSELDLNTASEAGIVFSPWRRLIVLRRGEMFVRSGADRAALFGPRALWVAAAHAHFEAIGTAFGVRQGDRETLLTVSEGRVAVHIAGRAPVTAQAGESYRIRGAAAVPERMADRGFDAASWTQGVLVARQMRLDAFVAELARYSSVPMRCAEQAAALRVSGVFQLDRPDAAERALEALVRVLPVRVERGPSQALTVVRR